MIYYIVGGKTLKALFISHLQMTIQHIAQIKKQR